MPTYSSIATGRQTGIARVSGRNPGIRIDLTARVELASKGLHSVAIGIPSSIPESLVDDLWLHGGICNGVHTAFGKHQTLLNESTIEVDFPELGFSIAIEELSEEEVGSLAMGLETITEAIVDKLLSQLEPNRPT